MHEYHCENLDSIWAYIAGISGLFVIMCAVSFLLQLINITRENWQPIVWIYLLYSFAIVTTVNFVMWLTFPNRTISFSPWVIWATSNIYSASFAFKYCFFASAAAVVLPKLWERRQKMLAFLKKRKAYKIPDDE